MVSRFSNIKATILSRKTENCSPTPIRVMEDAMANLLGMWEALYALKFVMERFSAEPSPAQIELLQKAIDGVNSFKEKSIGSKNAILLYYDFSSITKEYEVNKIDNILLELSDVISRTFVRMTELQSKGDPHGLMQVESEHVANSYIYMQQQYIAK